MDVRKGAMSLGSRVLLYNQTTKKYLVSIDESKGIVWTSDPEKALRYPEKIMECYRHPMVGSNMYKGHHLTLKPEEVSNE